MLRLLTSKGYSSSYQQVLHNSAGKTQVTCCCPPYEGRMLSAAV